MDVFAAKARGIPPSLKGFTVVPLSTADSALEKLTLSKVKQPRMLNATEMQRRMITSKVQQPPIVDGTRSMPLQYMAGLRPKMSIFYMKDLYDPILFVWCPILN